MQDLANYVNFGTAVVEAAPVPDNSGITVTVKEGRVPAAMPARGSIGPAAGRTAANTEVVYFTGSEDLGGGRYRLTMRRAREGSVARKVLVGDVLRFGLTAEGVSELSTLLAPLAGRSDVLLGTAVGYNGLIEGAYGPYYTSHILANFGLVVAVNECKPETIWPTSVKPDLSKLKAMAAVLPGVYWRFHCLLWHKQLPKWLSEWAGTKAELRTILKRLTKETIEEAVAILGPWLLEIDVANELAEPGKEELRKGSKLLEVFGGSSAIADGNEYLKLIGEIFTEARATLDALGRQDVKLAANEYEVDRDGDYTGPKGKAMVKIVEALKGGTIKCPIDTIGLQCHRPTTFLPEHLDTHMSMWRGLGVEPVITELTLEPHGEGGEAFKKTEAYQAEAFANIAAWVKTAKCKVLCIWGAYDGATAEWPEATPFRSTFRAKTGWAPLAALAPGGALTKTRAQAERRLRELEEARIESLIGAVGPPPEGPPAVLHAKPGIDLNWGGMTKAAFGTAKANAPAGIARAEAGAVTLANATKWAKEEGLKLVWIYNPSNEMPSSIAPLIAEYEALPADQKAVLYAVELGNENWAAEGEGTGVGITGKTLGERFIGCAVQQRAAGASFPVPICLQIDLGPKPHYRAWCESLGTVNHTQLREALEPTASLPYGNFLAIHPYGGKMTTKPNEQDVLLGGENAYKDAEGGWSSAGRWLKCQALVKEWTGLTVPALISEWGMKHVNSGGGVINTYTAMHEGWKSCCDFMAKVVKGEVGDSTSGKPNTFAPKGLVPVVAGLIYYDLYTWSNEQSYGIVSDAAGTAIATEEWNKRWREDAAVLAAA